MHAGDAAAHGQLASAAFCANDMDGALHHGREAFRLAPTHAHANTLGGALNNLARYAEALTFADHALSLRAGHLEALVNRAYALEGLARHSDASAAWEAALAVSPETPVIRHAAAMHRLALGQMTPDVWELFGARLQQQGTAAARAAFTWWAGEDIAGRTILLHAEEGLGDTLQFVRYAPFVAARAGRVVLAVQPPLLHLLRRVPGVDQVIAVGQALPAFDVVCPLLSLPGIFATTLGTIPPALPYADRFEPWDDGATGLRVGLAWQGAAGFAHDRHRSIPPAALAVLAGIAGVRYYGLQYNGTAPADLAATDLMHGVHDFADTAARIAGLDLVVCVDTAVAHLAATMGKPVWLLSRARGCWRWLHNRADSPWYPSLRVYRQSVPNDWRGVLQQVRHDLEAAARTARAVTSPGQAAW